MNFEEKKALVEELSEQLKKADYFYLADSSELTVAEINALRRLCFQRGVKLKVVKNTLIKKAFDAIDPERYAPLVEALKGPTSIMFTEVSNAPARIIKEFRKSHDKPVLKAAYIDTSVYIGDESLEELANLKSKEELIGDIIALLQSPAKNVISALQSGGNKLAGILKTLSEKSE